MKKILLIISFIFIISTLRSEITNAQGTCPNVPTNTGVVKLLAENVSAGTYKVWSRMKAADASNNSFYIKIDSENCAVLTQTNSTSWVWVALPTNVTLTAGTHEIVITGNGSGVGVDKLIMTKNLDCTPTGTSGDNYPAETLSPTSTITPTPTPSPIPLTNTPTPTPLPNTTILRFDSIKLHGIGRGGDNSNPNSLGNLSPIRLTRTITVELLDSSENIVTTATGNIIYKNTTGDFSGEISIESSIPSTFYTVKIKSPQFLKKTLGISEIITGEVNNMTNVSLTTGDVDGNNELNILDYNILTDCTSDIAAPKNCSDTNKKLAADLSDEGRVNLIDFNYLIRELSVSKGD